MKEERLFCPVCKSLVTIPTIREVGTDIFIMCQNPFCRATVTLLKKNFPNVEDVVSMVFGDPLQEQKKSIKEIIETALQNLGSVDYPVYTYHIGDASLTHYKFKTLHKPVFSVPSKLEYLFKKYTHDWFVGEAHNYVEDVRTFTSYMDSKNQAECLLAKVGDKIHSADYTMLSDNVAIFWKVTVGGTTCCNSAQYIDVTVARMDALDSLENAVDDLCPIHKSKNTDPQKYLV